MTRRSSSKAKRKNLAPRVKPKVKVLVVTGPLEAPAERVVDRDEIDAERLVQAVTGDPRSFESDGYYWCTEPSKAMTLLVAWPRSAGEPPPQALSILTNESFGTRPFRGAVVILGANHATGETVSMDEERSRIVRGWQAAALKAEGGRTPTGMGIITRKIPHGFSCEEIPIFETDVPKGVDPNDPFGVGFDPNDPFGVGAEES